MPKKIEVTLSNGEKVIFDKSKPKELYDKIVTQVLVPFYKETQDWNESIRKAINTVDYINKIHNLEVKDCRQELLSEIQNKLGNEISNIPSKIEILFLNMDDYTSEITKLMNSADFSKEMKIRTLGDLISSLNTFEMSELLYHYIEKSKS